ncbi:MAG: hypothetical protein DM484_04805 [Candidatus Methylumidiphilus alinenensis]|uniref:Uncharacterized protein n=1 Tax=Candidatus Methylumidiphilus alinenensis TaxID=2202197 RepID=A0A2W4RL18_9GAMM|nr:MAG: hypothetical protein DM484_04805 [Candidatus Methylumidiphilus alinenensis]
MNKFLFITALAIASLIPMQAYATNYYFDLIISTSGGDRLHPMHDTKGPFYSLIDCLEAQATELGKWINRLNKDDYSVSGCWNSPYMQR